MITGHRGPGRPLPDRDGVRVDDAAVVARLVVSAALREKNCVRDAEKASHTMYWTSLLRIRGSGCGAARTPGFRRSGFELTDSPYALRWP